MSGYSLRRRNPDVEYVFPLPEYDSVEDNNSSKKQRKKKTTDSSYNPGVDENGYEEDSLDENDAKTTTGRPKRARKPTQSTKALTVIASDSDSDEQSTSRKATKNRRTTTTRSNRTSSTTTSQSSTQPISKSHQSSSSNSLSVSTAASALSDTERASQIRQQHPGFRVFCREVGGNYTDVPRSSLSRILLDEWAKLTTEQIRRYDEEATRSTVPDTTASDSTQVHIDSQPVPQQAPPATATTSQQAPARKRGRPPAVTHQPGGQSRTTIPYETSLKHTTTPRSPASTAPRNTAEYTPYTRQSPNHTASPLPSVDHDLESLYYNRPPPMATANANFHASSAPALYPTTTTSSTDDADSFPYPRRRLQFNNNHDEEPPAPAPAPAPPARQSHPYSHHHEYTYTEQPEAPPHHHQQQQHHHHGYDPSSYDAPVLPASMLPQYPRSPIREHRNPKSVKQAIYSPSYKQDRRVYGFSPKRLSNYSLDLESLTHPSSSTAQTIRSYKDTISALSATVEYLEHKIQTQMRTMEDEYNAKISGYSNECRDYFQKTDAFFKQEMDKSISKYESDLSSLRNDVQTYHDKANQFYSNYIHMVAKNKELEEALTASYTSLQELEATKKQYADISSQYKTLHQSHQTLTQDHYDLIRQNEELAQRLSDADAKHQSSVGFLNQHYKNMIELNTQEITEQYDEQVRHLLQENQQYKEELESKNYHHRNQLQNAHALNELLTMLTGSTITPIFTSTSTNVNIPPSLIMTGRDSELLIEGANTSGQFMGYKCVLRNPALRRSVMFSLHPVVISMEVLHQLMRLPPSTHGTANAEDRPSESSLDSSTTIRLGVDLMVDLATVPIFDLHEQIMNYLNITSSDSQSPKRRSPQGIAGQQSSATSSLPASRDEFWNYHLERHHVMHQTRKPYSPASSAPEVRMDDATDGHESSRGSLPSGVTFYIFHMMGSILPSSSRLKSLSASTTYSSSDRQSRVAGTTPGAMASPAPSTTSALSSYSFATQAISLPPCLQSTQCVSPLALPLLFTFLSLTVQSEAPVYLNLTQLSDLLPKQPTSVRYNHRSSLNDDMVSPISPRSTLPHRDDHTTVNKSSLTNTSFAKPNSTHRDSRRLSLYDSLNSSFPPIPPSDESVQVQRPQSQRRRSDIIPTSQLSSSSQSSVSTSSSSSAAPTPQQSQASTTTAASTGSQDSQSGERFNSNVEPRHDPTRSLHDSQSPSLYQRSDPSNVLVSIFSARSSTIKSSIKPTTGRTLNAISNVLETSQPDNLGTPVGNDMNDGSYYRSSQQTTKQQSVPLSPSGSQDAHTNEDSSTEL